METKELKKSSREWAKDLRVGGINLLEEKYPIENPIIIIIDPKGWDKRNWEESINELITVKEFNIRAWLSSVIHIKPENRRYDVCRG